VTSTETPRVTDEDRSVVSSISEGVARVVSAQRGQIAKFDPAQLVYYTGHETIIPSGRRSGLSRWREALFAFMHHNAQRPGAYFKIPSAQIVEIGVEFEI
jgi:KUP system potassium uptake protein